MAEKLVLLSALLNTLPLTVFCRVATFEMQTRQICLNSDHLVKIQARSLVECVVACTINPDCAAVLGMSSQTQCDIAEYKSISYKINSVQVCAATGQSIFVKSDFSDRTCPSGFGNEFFGHKYKLLTEAVYGSSIKSISAARLACASLGGNARLADAIDESERSHIYATFSPLVATLFLDAEQIPGSPEPGKDFYMWKAANVSVLASHWRSGEPNDGSGTDNCVIVHMATGGRLNDVLCIFAYHVNTLCECLEPF